MTTLKNCICFSVLCALWVLCPSFLVAQCASTLVNNADFEQGFSGGNPMGGYYTFGDPGLTVTSSTNTPDGSATAAEMNFQGAFGALAQTVGGLQPQTEYTFSADILRLAGEAGYTGIAIYFRDASGADIGTPDFMTFAQESPNWQTLTRTLVSPAGTAQAQIAVQGDGIATTDNWCFFAAAPPEVEGCAGNLIVNGTLDVNDDGWFNYAQGTPVYSRTAMGGVAGSGGGELTPDAAQGFYGFGQKVAITVGERYLLRAEALQTATAGYANLVLQFQDAGGTPVAGGNFEVPLDGEIFQVYEVTGTAPAGATQVQVAIGAGNGAGVIADNLCLLSGAFVGPAQNEPDNLVFDGDFENATEWFEEQAEGWSCFGCGGTSRDVADPSTGTKAVRVTGASADDPNANGYNGLVFFYDSPAPGAEYTASADLKRLGTTFYGQLHLYFRDASGTDLADVVAQADDSGVYANYQVSGIAPAGTTRIVLALETGNAGHLLADNVVLLEDLALPVRLASFTGQASGKVNTFAWSTSTEENTAAFYLQRSTGNRGSWETISFVRAAGNARTMNYYEATDEQPLSYALYRLKSVDVDGAEQFSDVISITREEPSLAVYPNPVGDEINVAAKLAESTPYRLVDVNGRCWARGVLREGTQQLTIAAGHLPVGQYVLFVGGKPLRVIK